MDEDLIYKSIGKRIKYIREKKNLTQEKLAEKSGLSLDYIGKIEVSNALDIHIKELFNF